MLGNVAECTYNSNIFGEFGISPENKINFITKPVFAAVDPCILGKLYILKGGNYDSENPRAASRAYAGPTGKAAIRLVRFKINGDEKERLISKFNLK
jgi:hypothetical protein